MRRLTRIQTAFDIFAITMAALNAFDQPYRQSAEVVSHFKRDGAFLFIVRYSLYHTISDCSD